MPSDKTYTNWREVTGKAKNSYMASKLKESAGDRYKSMCVDSVEWEAAEHINKLELRLSEQKDVEENLWKSLDRMTKMRDNADKAHLLIHNENEFLKSLIRKYHLENDAFTGKGNIE